MKIKFSQDHLWNAMLFVALLLNLFLAHVITVLLSQEVLGASFFLLDAVVTVALCLFASWLDRHWGDSAPVGTSLTSLTLDNPIERPEEL